MIFCKKFRIRRVVKYKVTKFKWIIIWNGANIYNIHNYKKCCHIEFVRKIRIYVLILYGIMKKHFILCAVRYTIVIVPKGREKVIVQRKEEGTNWVWQSRDVHRIYIWLFCGRRHIVSLLCHTLSIQNYNLFDFFTPNLTA